MEMKSPPPKSNGVLALSGSLERLSQRNTNRNDRGKKATLSLVGAIAVVIPFFHHDPAFYMLSLFLLILLSNKIIIVFLGLVENYSEIEAPVLITRSTADWLIMPKKSPSPTQSARAPFSIGRIGLDTL